MSAVQVEICYEKDSYLGKCLEQHTTHVNHPLAIDLWMLDAFWGREVKDNTWLPLISKKDYPNA